MYINEYITFLYEECHIIYHKIQKECKKSGA